MKALLQRTNRASVTVGNNIIGKIDRGLVVFIGIAKGDTQRDADYLADKIVDVRVFEDENSKFDLSLNDIGGEALIISQFTLLADTRKGRRPSFTDAAIPEIAETMFNYFIQCIRDRGIKVKTGQFQTHMLVEIYNDGPVTILLDSKEKFA